MKVGYSSRGVEMNDFQQNGKGPNFEKAYPGCSGRMANLFELNLGVSANRLLTDKPHRDGSLSRSRSDVSRMSPSGNQTVVIVSEFKDNFSNRKPNGTPMKMLIAQEMSKEVDTRRSPPNLIAKLMGLDALPRQEHDSDIQRKYSTGHPRSRSDIPLGCWEQETGCLDYLEPNEFKDVYEISQQLKRSPYKGRFDDMSNDRKMALVRQKFVEAKRLSMDEKLRQSKQFQDALEVLNSNKELFLKCLQEPSSTFSQNMFNLQSVPPPETKRITVLRPSKIADNGNFSGSGNKEVKQMTKGAFVEMNGLEISHIGSSPPPSWKSCESPTQPTRIVVLKPSSMKTLDVKVLDSPQSESPRILHEEAFLGDLEDDENQESREVAKSITQQMRETLGRHRRDENLISSVFSNGYVGDESSFNRSEIDYVDGNLTDSEVMSPVSRHSWDYVNRLGSPFSISSFSRASYSPESSVCREAKKRLSERWAMMASNGSSHEQRHVRRNSSTLGEMLALSETKKAAIQGERSNPCEEPKNLNSLHDSEQRMDENVDNSPRNLMRSKSVPVSSAEFGSRLNENISVSDKGKTEASKVDTKSRSAKSLFKGKVSSLFFSRNKRSSKDDSLASEPPNDFQSLAGETGRDQTESINGKGPNPLSLGLMEPSTKASFLSLLGKQGNTSSENGLPDPKAIEAGIPGENPEQPSPISVLDPPFEEEEESTSKVLPLYAKLDRGGAERPLNSIRSNLIDKSPPIGSIARTLSWDDSCTDTASSHPPKESSTTQGTEEDEREWFFFVKTLLSVAGLQGEVQSNSFLARWHSPESPLDPSLRDKYIDLKDKEPLHEAKRRQKRSIRKLVFDCVNAALVDLAEHGTDSAQRAVPCIGANNSIPDNTTPSTMVDEVWARMNEWFSRESRCVSDDCGDDNRVVVERVVKKEVVGKGWTDHLRLEMDNLGKQIEGKLLEELVQEAVVELTGRL